MDWLSAHRASGKLAQKLEIGDQLLDRLFTRADEAAPDVGAWLRCGERHATYRALAADPRCPWSASHLNRCVQLSVQHQQLPPALAQGLDLQQCNALVPVPMPAKAALARLALQRGWSRAELDAEVGQWLSGHRPVRIGRPRTSVAAKALTRVQREVRRAAELQGEDLPDDPLDRLELAAALDAPIGQLQALAQRLRQDNLGGGVGA